MADALPFTCFWDKTINWVNLEGIEDKLGSKAEPISCWKCGKINFPNAIKKSTMPGHDGENYLERCSHRSDYCGWSHSLYHD
jgi:hypothetical protein